ncbi:hypothetical protein ABEB36_004034 [Hypothenemus hampei]|uniref:Uncharacterized protein n=1 Tax=Hypothenemus hampei TaxID=57062 RepID=A0ABD1F1Z4_HYPHA
MYFYKLFVVALVVATNQIHCQPIDIGDYNDLSRSKNFNLSDDHKFTLQTDHKSELPQLKNEPNYSAEDHSSQDYLVNSNQQYKCSQHDDFLHFYHYFHHHHHKPEHFKLWKRPQRKPTSTTTEFSPVDTKVTSFPTTPLDKTVPDIDLRFNDK